MSDLNQPTETATTKADIEAVLKAAKRLKRAETEYHRAIAAAAQPRLSKAGTAYQVAKWNLYRVCGLN